MKKPSLSKPDITKTAGPVIFLKEVKEELDKIVWPTREQTIRYSILVITVAVVTGAILGAFDYGLTLLTNYLINR